MKIEVTEKSGYEKPKTFSGIDGERLKTICIRGQISQGLLLPISILPEPYMVGFDATLILGIVKYELPETSKVSSHMIVKGDFPSFLHKTNQDRIQNVFHKILPTWEVTEKLDGSSMTVYLYNGNIGVCSHNIDLKESEENAFWRIAHKDGLIETLRKYGKDIAIQGELVGPSIQKNRYKLSTQTFLLFDIFDILTQKYLKPWERHAMNETLGIKHVHVFDKNFVLGDDINFLLKLAERKSNLCQDSEQEGFVFKCNDGGKSFKVISNKYLLSEI